MSRPSTILIDGKRYYWRDILTLRKEQLAASRQAAQLMLFGDLIDDSRPPYERTAAGRFLEPSLFTLLDD